MNAIGPPFHVLDRRDHASSLAQTDESSHANVATAGSGHKSLLHAEAAPHSTGTRLALTCCGGQAGARSPRGVRGWSEHRPIASRTFLLAGPEAPVHVERHAADLCPTASWTCFTLQPALIKALADVRGARDTGTMLTLDRQASRSGCRCCRRRSAPHDGAGIAMKVVEVSAERCGPFHRRNAEPTLSKPTMPWRCLGPGHRDCPPPFHPGRPAGSITFGHRKW